MLIAAHFCKFLAPAADEVIPGSSVETPEAALQSAAFHKSDYAVLLNVRYWDKFAFTGYAIKADMDITVIDVRTGKTLRHNSIIAKCPMGTFGREASVKECLRPKANAWASRAFDIGIGTPASPNVMPPPPSTPSMR